MEKLLTIFITSYNTEKYIDEIMHYYSQVNNKNDIELLFINDGSTDNTVEKIKVYQSKYPDYIRIYNQPNGGFGTAVNSGLREAKGKYIKEIDGDDWADPILLDKLVDFIKDQNNDLDMIYTPYNKVYEKNGNIELVSTGFEKAEGEYSLNEFLNSNVKIRMHGIVYRTDIIQKNQVRVQDHCFYVDQEYNFYPLQYVNNVYYIDLPIYQYRVGTEEQSMNPRNMYKNRDMHKTIIYNLIRYYNSTQNETIKNKLHSRLVGMCFMQIIMYYEGGDKIEVDELVDFMNRIRNFKVENALVRVYFGMLRKGKIAISFMKPIEMITKKMF